MPAPTIFNAATGQFVHAAAIIDPSGGATVDAQSRTALTAILAALRSAGIIAGGTALVGSVVQTGPNSALAAAITTPSGGGTIDTETRVAVSALLVALRGAGIVAGGTVDPSLSVLVLDEDTGCLANGAAIANVTTGATVDAESRVAINAALAACRSRSIIAQD